MITISRLLFILLLTVLAAGAALAQVDEYASKNVDAVATTPAEVRGSGATWNGTNIGGISFDRTFADCMDIWGFGPVLGSVQQFSVGATGAYNFDSTQTYDGYIHIYEDAFNPADATENCVIGNDDFNSIGISRIEGVMLQTGIEYFAVTSAFAAGDVGSFTNTIEGAGDVTLTGNVTEPSVPIPAASLSGLVVLALMLLLISGFAIRRMGS